MGWLRELMERGSPKVRSYGSLARLALREPSWPADVRSKARSLAAVFSKLDRNIDLEWLVERPDVQESLAAALRAPLQDIKHAIRRADTRSEESSQRLRLNDLRYARALDLLEEPLFPGLPPEVLQPSSWGQTWWLAASGSGRSVVGRWLEARGLAAFVAGRTWDDVKPQLASRLRGPALGGNERESGANAQPLFLELEVLDDSSVLEPLLARGQSICIATASRPDPPSDRWQAISSPAPLEYVDALVDWVSERLPARASGAPSQFEPRRVRTWLRAEPISQGIVTSVGGLLGLCGLADELGTKVVQSHDLAQLAERFCKQRFLEAGDKATQDSAWLRRFGYAATLGLLARTLTDSEKPWDAARSFDEWLGLVPVEFQRNADLEWMKLALAGAETGIRPVDVDRAARRVPPGAFRLVRALEHAGLLTPRGAGGDLALRPHWLGATLMHAALKSVAQGSPLEWGEGLLRPGVAGAVLASVLERVRNDDTAIVDEVLELELDHNPAQVAALECVFLAAGLTLLEKGPEREEAGDAAEPKKRRGRRRDRHELTTDLLASLWDEQLRLLVEVPGELPRRRVPQIQPSDDDPLLADAVWRLAALALSEQLPRGVGGKHPLLRPWLATDPPAGLERLLDDVVDCIGKLREVPPWALEAFGLVDRLRATLGPASGRIDAPHVLEQPGIILEEIQHGVLEWSSVAYITRFGPSLRALGYLASTRELTWPRVAEALWEAWAAANCPREGAELFAPNGAHSAQCWPHIPCGLLQRLLLDAREKVVPYQYFSADHWASFLEAARVAPQLSRDVGAWRHMTVEVAQQALAQGAISVAARASLAVLWERFPKLMLQVMLQRLDERRMPGALALIESAPDGRTAELVAVLQKRSQLLELPDQALHDIRQWLYGRILKRHAGWREAYGLLASIESAFEPTRFRPGERSPHASRNP